jgi:hypothetical protein
MTASIVHVFATNLTPPGSDATTLRAGRRKAGPAGLRRGAAGRAEDQVPPPARAAPRRHARGGSGGGLYKLRMQLTHSLKPPGANP